MSANMKVTTHLLGDRRVGQFIDLKALDTSDWSFTIEGATGAIVTFTVKINGTTITKTTEVLGA